MTAQEIFEAVMGRGASLTLTAVTDRNWRVARRRIMGTDRVEIEGPADGDAAALKRMDCVAGIVSWRTRLFAPDAAVLERVLDRWPIAA